MREIIFDTETTGLSAAQGDRIVEIGAVEFVDRFPTGRTFHHYLNPGEREVHPEAEAVHGLSNAMLADKPGFADILDDFLEFFGEGNLVAHNAEFDMGFVNAELSRLGQPAIPSERVVDTLMIARRKHPAGQNSLDALCDRYAISRGHRTLHGALLDSELLAEVYLELTGGRQAGLAFADEATQSTAATERQTIPRGPQRQRPQPLQPRLDEKQAERHASFVAALGEKAIWMKTPFYANDLPDREASDLKASTQAES